MKSHEIVLRYGRGLPDENLPGLSVRRGRAMLPICGVKPDILRWHGLHFCFPFVTIKDMVYKEKWMPIEEVVLDTDSSI